MSDRPVIEEREDGPLVAKGVTTVQNADGQPVEAKEVMALCRCGHSANKPFCDGSHKRVGFQSRGGVPAGKDRVLSYEGEQVTVFYNPRTCSHAAECGRLAAHIFNPENRPWIKPDNGSPDQVEAVVNACPSGALSMAKPGGAPEHRIADRPQVMVQKDGPYWITGVDGPVGPGAEGMSRDKYVLCRCGLSGNKPYCDGSHRDAGWKDTQVAPPAD